MIKHVVIKERKVTEKKDQDIETNAHVDENVASRKATEETMVRLTTRTRKN